MLRWGMGSSQATARFDDEKSMRARRMRALHTAGIATVSVGELRSSFRAVEAKLAKGMLVQVTRRGEVVAEIKAPSVEAGQPALPTTRFVDFIPEIKARLIKTWGVTPVDIDTTAMVSEGRDRDFLS